MTERTTEKGNLVAAVQCPMPTNPDNGKAKFTSVSYNSVVSYECRYGYTLVGQATRRCGVDKIWIGQEPFCKGKNNLNLQLDLQIRLRPRQVIQEESQRPYR